MIQRSEESKRWRQAFVIGSSLALSLALGFVAAQEVKQAPEKAQAAQPQAPAKEAPPIKQPLATAVMPVVPRKIAVQPPIIQGGVQIQRGGAVVFGAPVGPGQPGVGDNGSSERIKLPVDPRARRKIDDAKRFIEMQDWQSAVQILQMLLDGHEDNFLQEVESEKGRRVSVRAEANRLLGSLPREGKQFYELKFGAQAKLALKQAKANGNPQALAEVALKYVHTDAGAEAAALLGSYHLDHGRYIVAALCYERLMARDDNLANLTASTLLKAALAFERAGDAANRDKAWSAFQSKLHQGNEKLPAPLRSWDDAKLKATLGKRSDVRGDEASNDWPLFMGSPDRTAHSLGTDPFLEPMFPPYEPVPTGQARKEVEEAGRKLTNLGFPLIPGSHPLVVHNLVIFRALDGIHAFNLKTGQMEWNSTSDASLANMMRSQSAGDPESASNIYRYRDTAPSIITENTLLGTLSADQELVYAVEDMAIPPVTSNYGNPFGGFNPRSMPRIGDKLADFMSCNRLTAFDIEGGRAVWSIGTREPEQPFTDMFFLGPPLPLGEKLYVLGESNAEIKLLCLQTRRTPKPGNSSDYQYSVELVWSQPLGVVDRRITEDPVRRTQAATLSYSDGILICPTNAGSIVGVDLLTRSLVWAFSYQSEVNNLDADNMIFMGGGRARVFRGGMVTEAMFGSMQWSFSAPVISGGKVLLAPPDGKSLQAINLRDGSLAWSANRIETGKDNAASDNYLAGVFDGKVILVGKQSIRALELNTGKQLWRAAISTPVGRGTANETTYFVPVRNNEIWAIALKDGRITGKSKALHKEQIGNLVLVGDELVSLNHTALLVYPQQAVKERQVAERLKKNAKDPIGLLDRGELRWHQGDRAGAIADFRACLANQPASSTQNAAETKLFDADCELLDQDFNRHEELLAECARLLTAAPVSENKPDTSNERIERHSRLLRIVAKGREGQGRFLDALKSYQDYAKLDNKLIASPEDPQTKVLPWVWARSQAEALAKRIKPDQRQQLQETMRSLWQKAQQDNSLETMKNFVDFYGDIPGAGQEAQLLFTEKLIQQHEFAQAQVRLLPLLESTDAQAAAKAMDALARLNMRLGELENAAYYFRLLAKRYPKVIVRDGKTGLQLYQEIMTDKRFLPYLDEQRGLAGLREFTVDKDVTYSGPVNSQGFLVSFAPNRELPPALSRFALQVEMQNNNNTSYQYSIRDRDLPKPILQQHLNIVALIPYNYSQEKSWPNYQVCGSTFVFAWGNQIVGVDPLQKKQLWSCNVLGDGEIVNGHNGMSPVQMMPHQQLPNRFQLYGANGRLETLGTVGAASSQRVAITIKDVGLVGLDPQTGERIWTRTGVSPSAEMFGDSEYVIVLSGQKEEPPLAVRLSDGKSTVLTSEVETHYRNKLQQHGRFLLVKLVVDKSLMLALIDPLSPNAPIWNKKFDREALVLPTIAPGEIIGCMQPDGALEILDVSTGKLLQRSHLTLQAAPASFKQGHLLQDQQHYYVFLNQGIEQKQEKGNRQLYPQFQWLRSVAINGPAFALDKATGQVVWQEIMPLQYLVTQRFADLPILLCAATVMDWKQNNGAAALPANAPPNVAVAMRSGSLQSEVKLFSKQTGKALPIEFKSSDFERYNRGMMQNMGIHDLLVEPATGKVELKSSSQRFTFRIIPTSLAAGPTPEPELGAKKD